MAIISDTVDYFDGDVLLEGFLAYDDAVIGRRAGVMVNHTWVGLNDFVKEKTLKLATLGYFAFAVDMYGKGILGTNNTENSKLMQPFMDNRQLILSRMQAAYSKIKLMPWVDAQNISAIGFCFGGLCVLDLARSGAEIKAVVSFHGLLNTSKICPQTIKAKILILQGNDDPMVTQEQIIAVQQELTKFGADWQYHNYGNTQHAFTNPLANDQNLGMAYNKNADKRSWQTMKNFLLEVF